MNIYTLNAEPMPYGAFTVGGVTYPANVLDLWSDDDLSAIGVERIPVPPPPSPEPGRRAIAKSVVQERVNAIGKLGAVMAVLNSQPIFFARWFAPNWPEVFADDEGLLQILAAVGCTEAEIAMVVAE
jgi:hypothetical protein